MKTGKINISTEEIIKHIRHRSYMSGVERDRNRIIATGEVYTPTEEVLKFINEIPQHIWTNPKSTFADTEGCGDGQFLGEILIKRVESGIDFETALSTIFGIEKEPDNAELCRNRLLCNQEQFRSIVNKNIVTADSDFYHGRFDGTAPDPEGVAKLAPGVSNLFENWYEDQ